MTTERSPWGALGALCVGYFTILLDMTIVAVANPAIMNGLHTDMSKVIWVTSAYLLTFAVPLLITGRLGDRFGPKYLYLGGLAVFTLASLWCGLAGGIGSLIAARAVQGLGAALMAPQTMAVIGRIFPWDKRGAAMGVWGGVAGIATLIGPIFGGALIDNGGWQWIFYVNVPIGLLAFALGVWLVPALPTNDHRFEIPGVIVVAIGMSALVFGIQEGNSYRWAGWVWGLIFGGLVVLALFLVYQGRTKIEPLVPLGLFRNRNFSLGNVATGALGAAMTAQMVPSYFYLQAVRDLSPTKAALVFAPMAVVSAILSAGGRQALGQGGAALSADIRLRPVHPGGVVVHRPRHPARVHPADVPDVGALRYRQLLYLGATPGDRVAQPPAAADGCGLGYLQHHPPGRLGAR